MLTTRDQEDVMREVRTIIGVVKRSHTRVARKEMNVILERKSTLKLLAKLRDKLKEL